MPESPPGPTPIYVCRICGPHKGNGPMWCEAGCGSDYNEMIPYVRRAEHDETRAALTEAVRVMEHRTEFHQRPCFCATCAFLASQEGGAS